MTNREEDLLEALRGTGKAAISQIPVLGAAIAGWNAYNKSSHDRNIRNIIQQIDSRVDDIEAFFKNDYFSSEEGQRFTRKVIDAALDVQIEDKQELFINALINAPTASQIDELTKLKFIDILRQLSRAALMVLAEMHKIFSGQVRGPGRDTDSMAAPPLINSGIIAKNLSIQYDPYLVTSTIQEMESHGLFSSTIEWRRDIRTGGHMPGSEFSTGICYTDFAARFVEFITTDTHKVDKGKL